MPEYLSPGVYIEEQDTGPEPIEGVSTSVTGFVGVTQMGPLDSNPPVLVTSFPDFTSTFGTYFVPSFQTAGSPPWNLLPHAVAGFFNNGGQILYIKRIASVSSPPAAAQSADVEGGIVTRLASDALNNASSARLVSTRGIQVGTVLNFTQVLNGVTTVPGPLVTVTQYNDGLGQVWFVPPLTSSFRSQSTTVTAVGMASALTAAAASGATTAVLTSVQGIQVNGSELHPDCWWSNHQLRPADRERRCCRYQHSHLRDHPATQRLRRDGYLRDVNHAIGGHDYRCDYHNRG